MITTMTMLDQLLLFSFFTVFLALIGRRLPGLGWLTTLLYLGQMLLLLRMARLGYGAEPVTSAIQIEVFGQTMGWGYDGLSWLFALVTIGAGLASSCFASGDWGRWYRERGGDLSLLHLAIALNVFSMLLLLGSSDLLSLFIGWELVSWSAYLLMVLDGDRASAAGYRYINYAIAGAMSLLAGLALAYSYTGSLQYTDLMAVIPSLGTPQITLLVLLFGSGFGIKMGLLPFHLWQAAAYAESPGPGAAFLGAFASRMGLYALFVLLVKLIGLGRLVSIEIPFTFLDLRDLLAWVAAFTIIFPTFTALRQNDARMLLAWHGIGQGGYMLLGVLLADSVGSAGGIFHAFTHATYQAALFMSVHAVYYRTGTSDLNKLGGLIVRMPLSFMVMLFGIIGLAGLPPMNGFVSKWMIYRSLITEGMPLLFIAAVIGTFGTILSVYKLIHNMFLGQLRLEHDGVREAPWSMMLPMVVLSLIVLVTGYMPGLALDWVASAQSALGLQPVAHTLGGITSDRGSLNMILVCSVLFGGFGIGALIFYSGNRTRHVHQLDNYAGGHFLSADTRYQYSANFYAGLMRQIGPLYRGTFSWIETALVSLTDSLAGLMQGFYRAVHPAFYLLLTVALMLAWVGVQ